MDGKAKKALVLGMVLTLCVSADTPAADLGAINIQNNIETIGNNISVLNKDLMLQSFKRRRLRKRIKRKPNYLKLINIKRKYLIWV